MQGERIPFVPSHMEREEPLPKVSFREVYYLHQIRINRDLTLFDSFCLSLPVTVPLHRMVVV